MRQRDGGEDSARAEEVHGSTLACEAYGRTPTRRTPRYTLNLNSSTSPSRTTYSLPSMR